MDMYASGEGGRARGYVYISSLLQFKPHGQGGGLGGSLLPAAALSVCMPEDRESERAGHFFLLRFHRLTFTEWGEGGEERAAGQRWRFEYDASGSKGARAVVLFRAFGRSMLPDREARCGVSTAPYHRRWPFWYACQRLRRARA